MKLGFFFVSALISIATVGSQTEPARVADPVVLVKTKTLESQAEILVSVDNASLTGKDSIAPGSLVCVEASGVDQNSAHAWEVRFPATFKQYQTENGKLFLAMPAADVGLTLFISPGNGQDPILVRSVIKSDNSTPGPDPDPKDDQDKDGQNDTREKVRGVLVIQQKDKADPLANAILMSETWRNIRTTIDSKNAFWMDADQERAKTYLPAARRAGLPAVLLFNEKMELLEVRRLPKTESEFAELLK